MKELSNSAKPSSSMNASLSRKRSLLTSGKGPTDMISSSIASSFGTFEAPPNLSDDLEHAVLLDLDASLVESIDLDLDGLPPILGVRRGGVLEDDLWVLDSPPECFL